MAGGIGEHPCGRKDSKVPKMRFDSSLPVARASERLGSAGMHQALSEATQMMRGSFCQGAPPPPPPKKKRKKRGGVFLMASL